MTDISEAVQAHRERVAHSLAKRRQTMLARYGVESMCSAPSQQATMHLSEWFPDPDVPGVRMRILRGV